MSHEFLAHYLPVRFDSVRIVRGFDTEGLHSEFALRALPSSEGGLLDIFDLARMAPGTKETMAHLLLLPVASLITAICRNLVGVPTLSAFGPSLLAVTLMFADWRSGLVVFANVMMIGVIGRALLAKLKLTKVPRLSVILVLVTLGLTMTVSVLDFYGWALPGLGVFLPMVVLTMMIERFYLAAEEKGIHSALGALVGSLSVSGVCLLLIRPDDLGRVILLFPEALLFVAAALIPIGRYRGTRLANMWFPAGSRGSRDGGTQEALAGTDGFP